MTGTLVNFVAIIVGGLIGLVVKDRFPHHIQETVMSGLSLAVMLIGLQMALETESVLIVFFSLVIGGVIGELIGIEKGLNKLGQKIKEHFSNDNDLFVQGFVQASLIYCVGAMAIMGSIQDGLNNDPTILFNKSIIDGIASIAFTATFGIGVIFSAIPVFLYQGGITIMASWAQQFLSQAMITEMTATGGLLIMAIGLNMLGATRIRVGNLLPSLIIAIIAIYFFNT